MSTIEEQNVKESTRAVMARALPGLATIIDARRREGKVDLRTTIAVIVLDLDPEQHEGLVVRLMRADEALAYVRALVTPDEFDALKTTIEGMRLRPDGVRSIVLTEAQMLATWLVDTHQS